MLKNFFVKIFLQKGGRYCKIFFVLPRVCVGARRACCFFSPGAKPLGLAVERGRIADGRGRIFVCGGWGAGLAGLGCAGLIFGFFFKIAVCFLNFFSKLRSVF